MEPGQRDKRIRVEQPVAGRDGYGGRPDVWTLYGEPWARVRYGKAEERREAAQQTALQVATFGLNHSARWAAIQPTFRIIHAGGVWDIKSVVPLGSSEDIEITAVRQK